VVPDLTSIGFEEGRAPKGSLTAEVAGLDISGGCTVETGQPFFSFLFLFLPFLAASQIELTIDWLWRDRHGFTPADFHFKLQDFSPFRCWKQSMSTVQKKSALRQMSLTIHGQGLLS